jgi:hypothetical protein
VASLIGPPVESTHSCAVATQRVTSQNPSVSGVIEEHKVDQVGVSGLAEVTNSVPEFGDDSPVGGFSGWGVVDLGEPQFDQLLGV